MNEQTTEPIHPMLAGARCSFDRGWERLVIALCDFVQLYSEHNDCPPVKVKVVKEKFGTLRFQFLGGDDYLRGAAAMAAAASATICEMCGAPGETVRNPVIATLCPRCVESLLI